MEEKAKKNNWTQSKVENASKKINQEIYNRNRPAQIQIKLDDLSIFVNGRITRRGIAKGMVFIIDTAYHGGQFLGKISYPYGYQKTSKQVIIRTYTKAKKINKI